jgi:hypothetical protein
MFAGALNHAPFHDNKTSQKPTKQPRGEQLKPRNEEERRQFYQFDQDD